MMKSFAILELRREQSSWARRLEVRVLRRVAGVLGWAAARGRFLLLSRVGFTAVHGLP